MSSKDPKMCKQGTASERKHNFNNSSETWSNLDGFKNQQKLK